MNLLLFGKLREHELELGRLKEEEKGKRKKEKGNMIKS